MSTQVQKQARGSSWRDIQQRKRTGGKAATKAAKRRRLQLLFRGFLVLFIGVALVAGFLALRYFGSQLADAQPVLAETPIQLDFRSDGVLTEDWTRRILGSQLDQPVREIDVLAVKRLLEEQGQVSLASVSVVLPGTLRITLEEREPVLRVRVRPQSGPPETLLVARDGTLFRGSDYPEDTLRQLPGAAGLRVRMQDGRYEQLRGLEEVADLLEAARQTLPAVYRHWRVVDLSDWNPEAAYRPSLVRVTSSHIGQLVFSTEGVAEQLERLAGILDHVNRHQMGQPAFIDLSYGDEAVIRYK